MTDTSSPIDNHGNVHGDDGRFVSLGALFERERLEHAKDHENERAVARETAQRLEREVEQTALRLERALEETAIRVEAGVRTALAAVGATAAVHAEAHAKEHMAHERIHNVEKTQVDKAEQSMNKRLEGMNEFRQSLSDQSAKFVSRELFDTQAKQLNLIEKRMAYYAGAGAAVGAGAGLIIQLVGT